MCRNNEERDKIPHQKFHLKQQQAVIRKDNLETMSAEKEEA